MEGAPTEEEVIAGCRRGKRWAQRALFERNYEAIYRVLLSQSGNPAEAEDLVQETFLRAFQSMAAFKSKAKVSTWLTRIALNAFYDVRRRQRTHRQLLKEQRSRSARAGTEYPGMATQNALEEELVRREKWTLLQRVLQALSDRDREVIVLCDLEEHSYAEVAAILDVAEGTVASRLSRARDHLRRAVEGRTDKSGKEPEAGSSNG
ncbi:MAG: RNA polymerase sigma factor [Acidobacteria bacterium]|nr:RNA polymerase sigma factor [Acidobacteriota bacterium]